MKRLGCDHEEAARNAALSGSCDEALRAHVSNCRACREVFRISRYLQALASQSSGDLSLPDPGQIWWRAGWLARQAAAERAIRPIVIAQTIAAATAALAVSGWCAWNWPEIGQLLSSLDLGWLSSLRLSSWVWLGLALFGVAAVIGVRSALAED